MSAPIDDDEDISEAADQFNHLSELNAHLVGLVVKVDEDDDPGLIVYYQDGRVLRLIATSQFVGVAPISQGKVH